MTSELPPRPSPLQPPAVRGAPVAMLAPPMTADEVRLEILAQVLCLGVAVTEAVRRVDGMARGEGVEVPKVRNAQEMVRTAKRSGEASKVRARWDALQARRRKDADGVRRVEAMRLILQDRLSRSEVADRLGVHPTTVSAWLAEPESVAALHTEARVSAMLGAVRLDDDIARLRRIADALEAEGELTAAVQAVKAAADIEVKRINGAAKVVVEAMQVNVGTASAGPDPLAAGLAQVAQAMGVIDVEPVGE